MNAPITVALVDDDDAVRESWAALIDNSGTARCVAGYRCAETSIRHLPSNPPHVVLMDINLPKMSGIAATARLKTLRPDLCVIMLTTFDDNELIFGALRAGACGYLLKRCTPASLLEAIHEAHRGGAPMSSEIARQVVRFFHAKEEPAAPASVLTARERELLSLLAKGRHYKEIASQLGISVDTVRSHIRRIYERLHVHSRTEAVMRYLAIEPSAQ
jgi:DNA-binding NarL/FixJ family response regulator